MLVRKTVTDPHTLEHLFDSPPSSQEQFNRQVLALLISGNTAFHAVENPVWRKFFSVNFPKWHLPGSSALSGTVLTCEVDNIIGSWSKRISGKFATGQTDGWKNICHRALLTSTLNIEGEVSQQSHSL